MDDYNGYLNSVDRNTALEPEEIDEFFNKAAYISNDARRVAAKNSLNNSEAICGRGLGWDFGRPTSFAAIRYIKNGVITRID